MQIRLPSKKPSMPSTITEVAVECTPLDVLRGCICYWGRNETASIRHVNDSNGIVIGQSRSGSESIHYHMVPEEREGTKKKVQTISIDGGDSLDLTSAFKLQFGDEVTEEILALGEIEVIATELMSGCWQFNTQMSLVSLTDFNLKNTAFWTVLTS